jgi:chromosome segregation ATPase
MPMVDFELRMLATSLEAESLNFIHQHWRPIADERDQLRAQLAQVPAKRSGKSTEDADVRLSALTIDHANLKKQFAVLQDQKDDLQAELLDLRATNKRLQTDIDDLLADKRPTRTA